MQYNKIQFYFKEFVTTVGNIK